MSGFKSWWANRRAEWGGYCPGDLDEIREVCNDAWDGARAEELGWTSIREDVPRSPGWYIVLAPGKAPSIYAKPFLTEDPVAILRDMEAAGVTHWLCKLPEFPTDEPVAPFDYAGQVERRPNRVAQSDSKRCPDCGAWGTHMCTPR